MPETFFDRATLISLPGCVMIVSIISNGLKQAFRFNPKWLALALSIGLCAVGVSLSGQHTVIDYFLAVVNGFLVFTSAAGLSEVGAHLRRPSIREHASTGTEIKFFTSWFDG